jgi:hypothetical protein
MRGFGVHHEARKLEHAMARVEGHCTVTFRRFKLARGLARLMFLGGLFGMSGGHKGVLDGRIPKRSFKTEEPTHKLEEEATAISAASMFWQGSRSWNATAHVSA